MGCGGTSSLRNVTESSRRLSLDGPFAFHHLTEVRSYYAAAGIPVQRRRRRNQIGEVKVKEEEGQNDTSNLKDAPPFMKYPGQDPVLFFSFREIVGDIDSLLDLCISGEPG